MMPEVTFDYVTGIKKFRSSLELRLYLKQLLASYEKARDMVDSITGDMIRYENDMDKPQSRGWFKVGTIFANKTDPSRAGLDILFQILKEAKPKVQLVEASLKTLEKMEESSIPADTPLLLYIRDGVPERIVIGGEVSSQGDSAGQAP